MHKTDQLLSEFLQARADYYAAWGRLKEHGGSILKDIRREHGLNQQQFAELLGIDYSYLSKYVESL